MLFYECYTMNHVISFAGSGIYFLSSLLAGNFLAVLRLMRMPETYYYIFTINFCSCRCLALIFHLFNCGWTSTDKHLFGILVISVCKWYSSFFIAKIMNQYIIIWWYKLIGMFSEIITWTSKRTGDKTSLLRNRIFLKEPGHFIIDLSVIITLPVIFKK